MLEKKEILSGAPSRRLAEMSVTRTWLAPMALAVRRQTRPMGPAPQTSTLLPTVTPARRHACTPTESGSSRAPSSIDLLGPDHRSNALAWHFLVQHVWGHVAQPHIPTYNHHTYGLAFSRVSCLTTCSTTTHTNWQLSHVLKPETQTTLNKTRLSFTHRPIIAHLQEDFSSYARSFVLFCFFFKKKVKPLCGCHRERGTHTWSGSLKQKSAACV